MQCVTKMLALSSLSPLPFFRPQQWKHFLATKQMAETNIFPKLSYMWKPRIYVGYKKATSWKDWRGGVEGGRRRKGQEVENNSESSSNTALRSLKSITGAFG